MAAIAMNDLRSITIMVLLVATGTAEIVTVCVTSASSSCPYVSSNQFKQILCVDGADGNDCLSKVNSGLADTMLASNSLLYLAHARFGSKMIVVGENRPVKEFNNTYQYQGLAVVRKSSIKTVKDLYKAKSCHTGYRRTVGWQVPISHLIAGGSMSLQCNNSLTVIEQDIHTVAKFFSEACIPGPWAPDYKTNVRLQSKYSHLCSLCDGIGKERCGPHDPHAGYGGALDCLIDGADVAWSKLSEVKKFFADKPENQKLLYGFLCPDGKVIDMSFPNELDTCYWAGRPWKAWIMAASNKKKIDTVLTSLIKVALYSDYTSTYKGNNEWIRDALQVKPNTRVSGFQPPITPKMHLENAKFLTTFERLGCDVPSVKLCVESDDAKDKCDAIKQVLPAVRVRPGIECVTATELKDCMEMVNQKDADIGIFDGADVYHSHKVHKFVPIVSEKYGDQDATYYAVAVVKRSSGITSFEELRGKKSCHTGINKNAGWKMPVATLLKNGLIENGNCDFAGQIGKFFKSSCVPGAKSAKYDVNNTNPASLCDLCTGSEVRTGSNLLRYDTLHNQDSTRCLRNDNEAFYGYTGAFRCLVEGGGDVAFVKHTTVTDNTNLNGKLSWTKELRGSDFRLLCPDGGSADVVYYKSCNLAQVPAHKVLVNPTLSETVKEEARILLLRMSDSFVTKNTIFNIFGPYNNKRDLIFKDSATELVNIRDDEYHNNIQDAYDVNMEELETCGALTSAAPPTKSIAERIFSFFICGLTFCL